MRIIGGEKLDILTLQPFKAGVCVYFLIRFGMVPNFPKDIICSVNTTVWDPCEQIYSSADVSADNNEETWTEIESGQNQNQTTL